MIEFELDIVDQNGDPYGSGPLTSLTSFTHTARLSRGGEISFQFAANDPQAEHVLNKRLVKARARLGGTWQSVRGGVIENIAHVPNQDGTVTVSVSGIDMLSRIGRRNIRMLEIGAETGATLADTLDAIHTFVNDLTLWETYTVNGSVPTDYFYAKFAGESVLGALIYLADKTETFFYLEPDSDVINTIFSATFEDSGVRAIQANGTLAPNTCAITSLTRTIDSYDLATRAYIEGGGTDWDSALKLDACTPGLIAPVGFLLDRDESYIEHTTATAEFGLHDNLTLSFKEIEPISGTDADYHAAADFLFQCGFLELVKRSTLATQYTYDLTVAGCDRELRPGQTVRVVYYDMSQNIDINSDLYILESTTTWNTSGVHTSRLKVSTDPIWPKSSGDNAAERVVQTRIFQRHSQQSLNEWWENATLILGHDQADHIAEFPFVLGRSVIMVKQVVFRFKIESVLTAGYVYALANDETAQSDATNTGGESNVNSGPSNINTGAESLTNSGNNNNNTGAAAAGTTDFSGTGATSTLTGAVTNNDPLPATTENNAPGTAITIQVNTQDQTSQVILNPPDHYHTLPHGHAADLPQHTHGMNNHTHTIPNHSHTGPSHQHTFTNTHTHTLNNHNHTIAHTHTLNNHTHTIAHVHPQIQHVHGLPVLLETFEITRAAASRTYAMSELEYAVNGGAWVDLSTATSAGDGYFQIDITDDVTSPTIPYRPAQTSGNNVVEVRRKAGGGVYTIFGIGGGDGTICPVATVEAHSLVAGQQIGISGTVAYNGTYVVQSILSTFGFTILHSTIDVESTGTVSLAKSAQLLCKLGVRTVIGSIAFT